MGGMLTRESRAVSWQSSTSRFAGRERCQGSVVFLPPKRGTLLGPEGAGLFRALSLMAQSITVAPSAPLSYGRGKTMWERPSLENCTVDASIF